MAKNTAGKPIIKKSSRLKRASQNGWNQERRNRWHELVAKLADAGLMVRREELKRGHGWRALSGVCRSQESTFVFVDSRLAPEEQISFLSSRFGDLSSVS